MFCSKYVLNITLNINYRDFFCMCLSTYGILYGHPLCRVELKIAHSACLDLHRSNKSDVVSTPSLDLLLCPCCSWSALDTPFQLEMSAGLESASRSRRPSQLVLCPLLVDAVCTHLSHKTSRTRDMYPNFWGQPRAQCVILYKPV